MRIIKYIPGIVLSLFLTNFVYAQEAMVIQADQIPSHAITDQATSQKLQQDWIKRNSKIKSQPVEWHEIRDGYYGTYTSNNQQYMTVYDMEGNYIETLKKSDWNSKSPNPLQSSFDLSTYRTQEIRSYWEVVDPNVKGYYIELSDENGKISRLWANEKGDFTTTLPKVKSKY